MKAILSFAFQTSDRFVFRRSSFLCHHWPLLLVFPEAARLLEGNVYSFEKKIILMTVLMFNSRFTPYLFLVVKLMQMAMFPHRYPDTIKLYVVPNLTMFR